MMESSGNLDSESFGTDEEVYGLECGCDNDAVHIESVKQALFTGAIKAKSYGISLS